MSLHLELPLFGPATDRNPPRVLVVAELGVNHDGELSKALDLVAAAAAAGADAIKLQLFHPDRLLSNQAQLAQYQEDQASDVGQMLGGLTLDLEQMAMVGDAATKAGLKFIVTPFSPHDAQTLGQLNIDAVKIASPDAVNPPLLNSAATLGKPMLISTGTCVLEELTYAAQLLGNHRAGGALLQCISSYPAQGEDAGLGGITALADHFELPVGYSDHCTEQWSGALAVAAGACVIEKHLTYDRRASGPDHAASLEPQAMASYIKHVRLAQTLLGPRCKLLQAAEVDVRDVARQSLCLVRDLPAGHKLTADDLTVKRPGTGIPASSYEIVLGKQLRKSVRANDLLRPTDISAA